MALTHRKKKLNAKISLTFLKLTYTVTVCFSDHTKLKNNSTLFKRSFLFPYCYRCLNRVDKTNHTRNAQLFVNLSCRHPVRPFYRDLQCRHNGHDTNIFKVKNNYSIITSILKRPPQL